MGKLHSPTDFGDRIQAESLYDPLVAIGSFICNFDPADITNRELVFLAAKPSDDTTQNMLGQPFSVKWWVATKQQLPPSAERPGDVVVRVCLIDPDKRTLSTASKGVVKSLDLLRTFAPDLPYEPPIVMKLIGSDIGKGADFLQLIPATAK